MILQTLPDVICCHIHVSKYPSTLRRLWSAMSRKEHMSRMKKSHHMKMRKELDNTTIKVHRGGLCFYMGGNQQSHCSTAPPPTPLPPHGSAISSWLYCFLTCSAASLAPLAFSVSSATIHWVHCSSACFALLRLLCASPSALSLCWACRLHALSLHWEEQAKI